MAAVWELGRGRVPSQFERMFPFCQCLGPSDNFIMSKLNQPYLIYHSQHKDGVFLRLQHSHDSWEKILDEACVRLPTSPLHNAHFGDQCVLCVCSRGGCCGFVFIRSRNRFKPGTVMTELVCIFSPQIIFEFQSSAKIKKKWQYLRGISSGFISTQNH